MLLNQTRTGMAVALALWIGCASGADAALMFTADMGTPGDSFNFRTVDVNNPGNLLIGTSLTGQTLGDISIMFDDMEHLEITFGDAPFRLMATLILDIDAAGSSTPPQLTGGSLDDMTGNAQATNTGASTGQDPFAPDFSQSYTLDFGLTAIADGDLFHGITFEGVTLRNEPGDVSIIGLRLSLSFNDEDEANALTTLTVGEWVPAPAALPAGLLGLSLFAMRRRRH